MKLSLISMEFRLTFTVDLRRYLIKKQDIN